MTCAGGVRGNRTARPQSSRKMRLPWVAALVVLVMVASAGSARAAYQPAQLLSDSAATTTEFQSATEPSISADGEWVAFAGINDGLDGVWERNVQTGAVSSVATVLASSVNPLYPPPTGPSVSASGQFVAFTAVSNPDSATVVLPAADAFCPEVYVRNMAIPVGRPGDFTLVAEQQQGGSPGAILFASCLLAAAPKAGDLRIAGAQAAPGVAISADGSEVAFTVDSPSNLGQSTTSTTTPESQVAVRNIVTNTTTVVSATPQGAPTPQGGAYPSATSVGAVAWGVESDQATGMSPVGDVPASTAAISADGSTVAWMGTNLPAQLPGGASDVSAGMAGDTHLQSPFSNDPAGQEVEPLWRRISGPGAGVTTRLLAGAGLSFYGYNGYDFLDSQGFEPAIQGGSVENYDPGPPALSADGGEVVVTADAPNAARLAALNGFPSFFSELNRDLYAVNMSDPAAPRVTPLTQITSDVASDGASPSSDAVSGTIADPAISPDGTKIAFETDRTQFSLASPALITPPIQFTKEAQTFVADLATGTLQLATSTYDGLAPDGSSGFESIDNAGDVAVESTASNLIYGNVGGVGAVPEVDLFAGTPQSTAVATETLSAVPQLSQGTAGGSRWALSVSASARRTGTVRLRVSVPAAGVVRAVAAAQLPGGRTVSRARIPFRRVAAVRAVALSRSVMRLTVALDRAGRRDAIGRHGLYARIVVRFSAPGRPVLRQTVPVTFRVQRRHRPRHHRSPRPTRRHSTAAGSARGR